MTDMQVEFLAPSASTNSIHNHFVELIHAWNLNPCKRNEADGVAAVDEIAEARGVSLFSFTSREGREDFLDFYGLNEFVLSRSDKAHHWVILRNRFSEQATDAFLSVYADAMANLADIENERARAIRTDGNRVGFICVDHFTWRGTLELSRIRQAREALAITEGE